MAAVCSCCDVDLCEWCGHGCECQHAQVLLQSRPVQWEMVHDLAG